MALSKKQWQEQHGFDDDEMDKIDSIKKIFNGKIVKVSQKPWREIEKEETLKRKQQRLLTDS